MTNSVTLSLSGELYRGGTTETAQIAFVRLNGEAIKSIGLEYPFDKPSTLRDDVIAILERDWGMDVKRGTRRAIRELICAGQSDEKVQREKRLSVSTKGRKSTVRSDAVPSGPTSARAQSRSNEETSVTVTHLAAAPPAPPEWPVLRTKIVDLSIDGNLRALLLAVYRKEPVKEIVRLRSALTSDWRSQDLPVDVQGALRWVDAQA